MLIEAEFEALLEELYEGPLQSPPWSSFLTALRRQLSADTITLLLNAPVSDIPLQMLSDGGSAAHIESYSQGQFVLDPMVDLPHGEVTSLRAFIPEQELVQTEFYKVIMQPQNWNDFLALDLRIPGELDARLRLGRYTGSPRFAAEEVELLTGLVSHLERAIRLHTRVSRLQSERAVYAGAVEQMAVATILLDEACGIVSCNDKARALLDSADGIAEVNGRLLLTERGRSRELQDSVSRVFQSQQLEPALVEVLRVSRQGGAELGLLVRPVPGAETSQVHSVPTVAVFVSNPESQAEAPVQIISRLFGLTPTEATLTMLLANGLTLDEASEELGVSRNTTRTHLRAVFSKTGVSRQTMLVRLVLQSVAPLA